MKLRSLTAIIAALALLVSVPALAQIPAPDGVVVNRTPVQGGTNGNCLYVNGLVVGQQSCGGAANLTVGTSTISSGTTLRVLYDNAGVLGEYTNAQLTALVTALPLTALATQATNTITGNATSGSAAPTALAIGTCSTAASALIWTTNTGFGCNTSITAAAAPASGLTGTTLAASVVTSSLTTVGTIGTGVWQGTKVGLLYGGTNADLSATGGASQFLKQASAGAAITVVRPACADLSNAAASCSTDATSATNITSGSLPAARLSLGQLTNTSADVALNNTALYFDGPAVGQGSTGTWFASGSISAYDSSAAANILCKLWDGTTVISQSANNTPGANSAQQIALSGFLATPTGNLRISCADPTSVNGHLQGAQSTITVFRLN